MALTGSAISAIDEGQFDAMRPPAMVSHFPADLRDTSLEYSGIYEDGWVSESSFLRLRQPENCPVLRIRSRQPGLSPLASALRVVVGGVTVAQVALKMGENDLKIPLVGQSGIQRVELHFDRATRLPSPDNRPASALLRSVGFEPLSSER